MKFHGHRASSILATLISCAAIPGTAPAAPSQTPVQLILASERVDDDGAIRVFDLQSRQLIHHFSWPTWSTGGAGRHISVSPIDGHLWASNADLEVYEFDEQYHFVQAFDIDVSGAFGTSGHGITGFDVGHDGLIYAAGSWSSCSNAYLFVVDPASQATLETVDLRSLPGLGGFCSNDVSVGPVDAFGNFDVLVGESASLGAGRIAVLRRSFGLLVAMSPLSPRPSVNCALGELEANADGSVIVCDQTQRRVVKSDPSRTIWAELPDPICSSAAVSSYSGVAAQSDAVGTSLYYVAGPINCAGHYFDWRVFTDAVGSHWTLDSSVGGMFAWPAHGAELRMTPSFPPPDTFCTAKPNSLGCTPAIASTGRSSASANSGFAVHSSNALNQKAGLLFYSKDGGAALPFTGGTLCVGGTLKRVQGLNSGGNAPGTLDCSGAFAVDMNSFAAGLLGGNPAAYLRTPGTRITCQFWGRDPGFAAPDNTQLTDGLHFTVAP